MADEAWRNSIPQIPNTQAAIDAMIEVIPRDGIAEMAAHGTGFSYRGQRRGFEARLKNNHSVWGPGLTEAEAKSELMRIWRSMLV